ncbi:UDP-3-O-(3-hydroxymyristoyl)glucosamine N-acyltransferase [Sulfurimonas sp. HSL-1716]|uniref:UDP-3-O-(3-hydroxymyristoyl)glucosamine N-acyltransferase n=1 Tax=Hydrocurvibacter sulfurireducens TaxID=3131937 RepID=UPI0031F9DA28
MLLSDIAEALACKHSGEDVEITSMNNLTDAMIGQLSFAEHKKYATDLKNSNASAFLIPSSLIGSLPQNSSYIVCDNVSLQMAYATKLFAPKKIDFNAPDPVFGEGSYVDKRANVENGVVIGKNCTIMAGVYLGSHVQVGDNTTLYANTTVYRDCRIGSDCIIHSGAVVGADGFGFSHTAAGEHVKIYQNGNVIIEDDVEIGANCAIDRAVFGSTRIKKGVKLDNFIHIGHNCEIGEYSLFVAQSGVGGSTKLGRNCVVSGQSAFTDHLDIAPFSTFTARSGITKSIKEPKGVWSGYPLMPHKEWMKLQSKIAKLIKE